MAHIVFFVYRQDASAYLENWKYMETHAMGGTESSVLWMASTFRALGHQVRVTNRPTDLCQKCDIFVSVRGWKLYARGVRPGRLNYLWCTDDVDQPFLEALKNPAVAATVYRMVDGVMMLSAYQHERWTEMLHLPSAKSFRTSNGIPSESFSIDPASIRERPRHAYYGSTPFRGLHLLLNRWPRIRQQVPEAELHIFSSMRVYGIDDTAEFEDLYRIARLMPGVHYRGAEGQIAIRKTIRRCRVLAYPCTFPETSCITAMEAMASGCVVVGTALGALSETADGNLLEPVREGWLDCWEADVVRLLIDDEAYGRFASHNLSLTVDRDWRKVALLWLERFASDASRQSGN